MSLFRRSPLFILPCLLLLAACASKEPPPAAPIVPPASYKVHPGLLGQPVPPGLQPPEEERHAAATSEETNAEETPSGTSAAPGENFSIYFDYNSEEIRPEARAFLVQHARHLAENAKVRARIEGNADERGSPRYNRELGMRRALAVRKILQEEGARKGQMRALSHGDSRPRKQGQDENSWAENRRVDVIYDQ
jgi:peptidoglycan-associated lipoprotein